MTSESFLDFQTLLDHFTVRKKDLSQEKVLISQGNWFNYGEGEDENGSEVSHPGEYWMRSPFSDDEPWQKVCLLKGRRKLVPPIDIEIPIKYPEGHPLNPNKIADLQKMISYLPNSCKEFFGFTCKPSSFKFN